jgi:hypothetical protein
MLKPCLLLILTVVSHLLFAQSVYSIDELETGRIISVLASDSLEGRGSGEPGVVKAAHFIGNEFRKNNLKPLPGLPSYYLAIDPANELGKRTAWVLNWNGSQTDHFIFIPSQPGHSYSKSLGDFKVIKIDSFFTEEILKNYSADTALLLWSDKIQPGGRGIFPPVLKPPAEGLKQNVLLVYAAKAPDSIELKVLPWLSTLDYNVVGILPGKSKPDEVILFSAHYDHLGTEISGRRRKKVIIMNGANDNASGTTAIVQLASYFAKRNDNERTLIFCAFAGEEMGLHGSRDFLRYIKPQHIIANINLEMIGISQYGSKTVLVTGDFESPLSKILQRNTPASDLSFIRDKNPEKRLFERSDNYSFALEGVPALSLMSSDDDDFCYHKACDKIGRIEIENMNDIIRAIARSVSSLVKGTETPERFDIEKYRRMFY